MHLDIFLIGALRAVVEVAGFALLGQGALTLMTGARRHDNLVYRVLESISRPAVRLVRNLAPRRILDPHIPMLAFFLLFWMWILLALGKRYLCGLRGLVC